MIEIGKSVKRPVMTRIGGTHKIDPATGQPEYKFMPANLWRVTRHALDGSFGAHKNRKLVVGLLSGDLVVLYPAKTSSARVTLKLSQLYRYGLQCKALIAHLEKARKRKEKLAQLRATRRLDAAERRMREQARKDNGEN